MAQLKTSTPPSAASNAGFASGAVAARAAARDGSANGDAAFQRGYKQGWNATMSQAGYEAGRKAARLAGDGGNTALKPGRDSIDDANESLAALKHTTDDLRAAITHVNREIVKQRRLIARGAK